MSNEKRGVLWLTYIKEDTDVPRCDLQLPILHYFLTYFLLIYTSWFQKYIFSNNVVQLILYFNKDKLLHTMKSTQVFNKFECVLKEI